MLLSAFLKVHVNNILIIIIIIVIIIINPLKAELNSMFHLLAFLGAHHILHVSRVRVNYNWVVSRWQWLLYM